MQLVPPIEKPPLEHIEESRRPEVSSIQNAGDTSDEFIDSESMAGSPMNLVESQTDNQQPACVNEVAERVEEASAWVLSTKKTGDRVAGWLIVELDRNDTRETDVCERCTITSYCYPEGAKLVRAVLNRNVPVDVELH